MIAGIYKIENIQNNKKYLGSSKDVKSRLENHKTTLKRGKHHNAHLQSAWNKYGEHSFTFEIIDYCEEKHKFDLEQNEIDKYDFTTLYNINNRVDKINQNGRKKDLLLLDLKGNLVEYFESGLSLSLFLYNSMVLNWKGVNTKRITLGKYRIVTVKFYNKNFDIIKTWKPYTDKTKWNLYEKKVLYLYTIRGTTIEHNSLEYIAEGLGLTQEAIRVAIVNNEGKKFYKKQQALVEKKPYSALYTFEEFLKR